MPILVIFLALFILLPITFGWFLVDYSIGFILGTDIHWIGDLLIAAVSGGAYLPVALVCFVLEAFGVSAPLVQ